MKRMFFIALGLTAVALAETRASLGQDQKQIEALYGKPQDDDPADADGVKTVTYQKGDYIILVQLYKGQSVAESFTRLDKRKLSEKETTIFLKANSGGKEWAPVAGQKQHWERNGGTVKAWCETLAGRPTFLVSAK